MEAIGFTIGVASIASLFQTCLHGYRSLNTAMAIGNTALTLNIQFRVEELRLYLWGRNWGLVIEPADPASSDVQGVKSATSLDTVDSDFEIPGLRDLTIEILGRIHAGLEEWKMVGERYGAATPKGVKTTPARTESSQQLLSGLTLKQENQQRDISDMNRLKAKLRWAMKDKPVMDELLSKLISLNDSLEKLLPRKEQTTLARGLTSEILNILESAESESFGDIDAQLLHLQGMDERKTGKIVQLKRANRTQRPEKKRPTEGEEEVEVEVGPTPFSSPSVWTDGQQGSMEIPPSHILRLTEPKLQYYQTSIYAPLERSCALYSPIPPGKSVSDAPATAILIEWRPAAAESTSSKLTPEELKTRRDHIARLLHRTAEIDAEFRVLDCVGYITGQGHTPDGSTHELVGYVYRYPDWASPLQLPTSLRQLLGDAYASPDPATPPLDERYKLAQRIAIALYQLQCAGWVHRKISSYNILFFRDRSTQALDFAHPFLGGWQYARPDDQRTFHPSEDSTEGIGDLDMYVHRSRLHDRRGGRRSSARLPRFRKSFDIYSLGIVLMELAFWEPIMALASESERGKMAGFEKMESGERAGKWWAVILKTAKGEIAAEMGGKYRDAVLFCLEGHEPLTRKFEDDDRDYWLRKLENRQAYLEDTDFEQVGLEKEYFWKVVNPLERLRI